MVPGNGTLSLLIAYGSILSVLAERMMKNAADRLP
jgi:hypothetical protein